MDATAVREVLLGATIGWAAGISPGPLNLLVVQAALRSGAASGARVAIAPLITDAPIIALGVLVASGVPERVLTGLSVAGGLYLMWLAVAEWRSAGSESTEPVTAGSDVRRGAIANALSPHPWLFWLTVGGPITVEAWDESPAAAVGFVVAFFVLLIGVKMVIAFLVARAGRRLGDRGRGVAACIGAVALGAVGVVLIAGALT